MTAHVQGLSGPGNGRRSNEGDTRVEKTRGPGERVECRASHAYPGQPTAVWWHGARKRVEAILASWRNPEGPVFRVRVDGGEVFQLLYQQEQGVWKVEPG